MQDTNIIIDVSEIIGSFDIAEITEMINLQITKDDNNDDFGNLIIDHFQPLWLKYNDVLKSDDEELKDEAKFRFGEVCNTFIKAIEEKYDLEIDYDWVNETDDRLYTFTIALYSFFIIDIKMNLCYVLYNYIITNVNELNQTFDSVKIKKDAATNSFKKTIRSEYHPIIANIYDITQWILDNIDTDQFFDYMEEDYFPLSLIRSVYETGYMSGDFILKIQESYKSSLHMRSIVCYDIMEKIINNFSIPDDEKMKNVIKED